jgi:hypothetical protein
MPPATFPLANTPFGNSDGDRSYTIAEAWWALGLSYYAVSVPNINLGAIADTLIPMPWPAGFSNYLVDSAWIVNPSDNANSAKIGLFTQPNGGGTAIIAGIAMRGPGVMLGPRYLSGYLTSHRLFICRPFRQAG